MYDLIIVGGGPAGASAAIYAARKRLKTIMILEEWGGQSNVSEDIQNWIGTPHISGANLAAALKQHVTEYAGEYLEVRSPMRATAVSADDDKVSVTLSNAEVIEGSALFVATGANRRKLEATNADIFEHKGLTYCASCDGPLFADQDVAVIGGGNAAFETALQLLAYCKSVTLLNRSTEFRADEITVSAARMNPKMKIITNVVTSEIVGEKFVSGLTYTDLSTNEAVLLPVTGIFVEIGLIPNSGWLGNAVELSETKQVVVDPRTQRTSHPRIWAAGDITNGIYHQNNIASGDAVKALEDIYVAVRKNKAR